jgi:hypothetical protein
MADGGSRASLATLVGIVAALGIVLSACSGGTTSSSGAPHQTTVPPTQPSQSQPQPQKALVAFGQSVETDNQNLISPQVQAIASDVTAGYQALTNGVNSASALGQQQTQQDIGQAAPNSAQSQQITQCVQAAGANVSAIEQCEQPLMQSAQSNQQALNDAGAQAFQQAAADVKSAGNAFSSLYQAFLGEYSALQHIVLTGTTGQLAQNVIEDYARLAADCATGAAATDLGTAGAAEQELDNDRLTWISDYDAFVAVIGLSADAIS